MCGGACGEKGNLQASKAYSRGSMRSHLDLARAGTESLQQRVHLIWLARGLADLSEV